MISTTQDWQTYESACLTCDPSLSQFAVLIDKYTASIRRSQGLDPHAVVDSLVRVTQHFAQSKTTRLIFPCSALFEVYCLYQVWRAGLVEKVDQHQLAALAVVSTMALNRPHAYDVLDVINYVEGGFAAKFKVNFETRVTDLCDVLFGKAWTTLHAVELNDSRAVVDTILSTRPPFVRLNSANTPQVTPELPGDLTL